MSDADELLRSGDLDGARAALVEVVRRDPGHVPTRMFLFQLLALAGEWDKARVQLDTLARLSPEAAMLATVYNQAIAAERVRESVWAGQATAEQHLASDWLGDVAEAIRLDATGDHDGAAAARERAFDAAPDTPGQIEGQRFAWIADADPRLGPCFEVILAGRYGLQAFDQVERISSEGPRDLRDLVWYPVQIGFRNGQSAAALLPARYPGSHAATDPAERLARATGWTDAGGSGQHLLATSEGDEHGLLSLRLLRFD
jgi:protein involved in temperature-dependent protein secretion